MGGAKGLPMDARKLLAISLADGLPGMVMRANLCVAPRDAAQVVTESRNPRQKS